MSITFALALATASVVPAAEPCSWDHPGRNPYRGSIAAAIDRYTDIPPAVASTLKRRMAENQADDKVIITRDAITGREQYAPRSAPCISVPPRSAPTSPAAAGAPAGKSQRKCIA
jgi:hypothetical protein